MISEYIGKGKGPHDKQDRASDLQGLSSEFPGEDMKLKADNTKQKLRGAYYTPLPLAEMMVDLFDQENDVISVLEPSCGDGVFLDAVFAFIPCDVKISDSSSLCFSSKY